MTIHPESILFWAGTGALARYGTLVRRTTPDAPAPAFQRAGPATFFGRDGRARQAAAGRPRVESLDLDGDGVREAGVLLLEAGRGNVLFDSSNFAPAGTAWTGEASFTLEPVASLIDGQTAYKHTNDGLVSSRNRSQTRGVFTGSPETFYLVIENVDAASTGWGIFDATASAFVARGSFIWATETAQVIEGTGPVRTMKIADAGPNGGVVYLLAVTGTGTAGDDRLLIVYPTGTGTNTQSAIIHHAQYEEAPFHSSPIVTTASAGATRAADGFVQPFGHAPQAMTLYVRFVDLGTGLGGGSQGVFYIGDAARAGLPRFECWASSAGTYTLKHHNGVVEVSSPAPGGLTAYRDVVEFRCPLRPDGAVQLNWAVNGGAEASGPVTAPNPFAPAWGGAALYLNSLGSVFKGYAGFFDLVALRGSDWTMDQIRQFLA